MKVAGTTARESEAPPADVPPEGNLEPPTKPAWLLALGRREPPQTLELESGSYRLARIFKHDFFAFTARYDRTRPDQPHDVVLKIGRRAWLGILPLGWIGRLHSWHECRVFEALEGIDVVPPFLGRYGAHGILHAYVPGKDLARGERVPDEFFDHLDAGLAEVHARGLAYVDLEKPENVLISNDGAPYLFDFQIAWYWPRAYGGALPPLRWIRDFAQRSDRYHVLKLRRKLRPDQLDPEALAASRRRPAVLRLLNRLTRPAKALRRRFLRRVDPSRVRGREHGALRDERR